MKKTKKQMIRNPKNKVHPNSKVQMAPYVPGQEEEDAYPTTDPVPTAPLPFHTKSKHAEAA